MVPVIKLVKAVADCFITRPSRKISGYHIESLAIDAFEDYQGPLDPKAMLAHLLGHSIHAVTRPIIDSTGQSTTLDDRQNRAVEGHLGGIRFPYGRVLRGGDGVVDEGPCAPSARWS